MNSPLKLGTRGSALALWQARWVADRLRSAGAAPEVEIVVLRTRAEQFPQKALAEIGVGVFTRELDDALLRGEIDFAVHSLKDLPSEITEGLTIAAVPPRESPADAFVSADGTPLDRVSPGARIGTSSPRRKAQLLAHRPDLEIVPIRGNVETRLAKIQREKLAGTILAHAGLRRMGYEDRITNLIDPRVITPAVSQGAVGVVAREGDEHLLALLGVIEHAESRLRIDAERAFLRTLRGGCQAPVGGLAELQKGAGLQGRDLLAIEGVIASPDGSHQVRARRAAGVDEATDLGEWLARELLDEGGAELLHPPE